MKSAAERAPNRDNRKDGAPKRPNLHIAGPEDLERLKRKEAGQLRDQYVIHEPEAIAIAAPTEDELAQLDPLVRKAVMKAYKDAKETQREDYKRGVKEREATRTRPKRIGILSAEYQANMAMIKGQNPTDTLGPMESTGGITSPRYQEVLRQRRQLAKIQEAQEFKPFTRILPRMIGNFIFGKRPVPLVKSGEAKKTIRGLAALLALGGANIATAHPEDHESHRTGSPIEHALAEAELAQAERTLSGPAAESALNIIDRMWQTKGANAISRGHDTASQRLAMHTQLKEALEDGRVHHLSLDDELASSMGIQESEYRERSITQIIAGHDTFDWYTFSEDFQLSAEQRATTERLVRLVSPGMIESIFLNEVMGEGDGEQNVAAWARTLGTLGEGTSMVPTLGDRYGIVGPGQETLTLAPDQSVGRMSRYISSEGFWYLNLPTSFADTRSDYERGSHMGFRTSLETNARVPRSLAEERLEVALNAAYNIARASQSLESQRGLNYIAQIAENTQPENARQRALALTRLAEFVGMAHNNPGDALKALSEWSRAGHRLNIALHTYAPRDSIVQDYGARAVMNYPAMEEYATRVFAQRGVRLPQETPAFERIRSNIRRGIQ